MNRLLIFEDSTWLKVPDNIRPKIRLLSETLCQQLEAIKTDKAGVVKLVRADECIETLNLKLLTIPTPSVVIDMTGGKLSTHLTRLDCVPTANIGLSRVRKLDERLSGVGFLKRGDWNRLLEHDLTHPLILDDVVWSGRSILAMTRLLGLSHDSLTVACMTGNVGLFGKNDGGIKALVNRGIATISGAEVATPQEDGFHLEDFAFRENELFGRTFTLKELKDLKDQGVFIDLAGLPKKNLENLIFGVNPPNYLMPSFQERINFNNDEQRRHLFEIGQKLDRILNDPEGRETQCEVESELNFLI